LKGGARKSSCPCASAKGGKARKEAGMSAVHVLVTGTSNQSPQLKALRHDVANYAKECEKLRTDIQAMHKHLKSLEQGKKEQASLQSKIADQRGKVETLRIELAERQAAIHLQRIAADAAPAQAAASRPTTSQKLLRGSGTAATGRPTDSEAPPGKVLSSGTSTTQSSPGVGLSAAASLSNTVGSVSRTSSQRRQLSSPSLGASSAAGRGVIMSPTAAVTRATTKMSRESRNSRGSSRSPSQTGRMPSASQPGSARSIGAGLQRSPRKTQSCARTCLIVPLGDKELEFARGSSRSAAPPPMKSTFRPAQVPAQVPAHRPPSRKVPAWDAPRGGGGRSHSVSVRRAVSSSSRSPSPELSPRSSSGSVARVLEWCAASQPCSPPPSPVKSASRGHLGAAVPAPAADQSPPLEETFSQENCDMDVTLQVEEVESIGVASSSESTGDSSSLLVRNPSLGKILEELDHQTKVLNHLFGPAPQVKSTLPRRPLGAAVRSRSESDLSQKHAMQRQASLDGLPRKSLLSPSGKSRGTATPTPSVISSNSLQVLGSCPDP